MKRQSSLDPPQELIDRPITLSMNKILWRVDEAAKELGISKGQVRALADTGELEAVPINSTLDPKPARRHIRITARSIEAFLNRRRLAI